MNKMKNRTYLTVGQDLFAIQDYINVQYNYSLHQWMNRHSNNGSKKASDIKSMPYNGPLSVPTMEQVVPAAVMVYTDLQTLAGLETPADYGSGIEYANGLFFDSLPTTEQAVDLQLGLWLNGSQGCLDIVRGKLSVNLHRLFQYLLLEIQPKQPKTEVRHTYLRVGYEFDNPDFGYWEYPQLFREAFATVVRTCHERYGQDLCRQRISFVWHSWAAGVPRPYELRDYFPDPEVVDWVGVSIFQQFYNNKEGGNRDTLESALEFASEMQKPIMIAESTPFFGVDHFQDPWKMWFQPILDVIEHYDIDMWSYIHCDWNKLPMWKGTGFGDTRLNRNSTVLRLWKEHVLQNVRFVMAIDGEDNKDGNDDYENINSTMMTTNPNLVYAGSSDFSRQWKVSGPAAISGSGEFSMFNNSNNHYNLIIVVSSFLVLLPPLTALLRRRYNNYYYRHRTTSGKQNFPEDNSSNRNYNDSMETQKLFLAKKQSSSTAASKTYGAL